MEDIVIQQTGQLAHEQIADYIRRQIAMGKLKPHDRLPTVRTMAQKTGLDPGTVARAYQELEREGAIVSRRGAGCFVSSPSGDGFFDERRRMRLNSVVEKTIVESLGLGFSIEDIETTFILQLADWRERRISPKDETILATERGSIRFHGSHDLAIELLARHLNMLHPRVRFETTFVGSLSGLMALERGEADIAGAHLVDEETGEFNISFIKKMMPNENVAIINLMQRIQGLMVEPHNPNHILGIQDLTRPDITFVNRQKGSGTRILLDSRLRQNGILPHQVKGYEQEENTHTAVASLIARGSANVGLGAQSAAAGCGLDFIPLFKERYDLIFLKERLESEPLNLIQETVASDSFRHMLDSIPGYDTNETGKLITINSNPGTGARNKTSAKKYFPHLKKQATC